jgi:hypothetical protein
MGARWQQHLLVMMYQGHLRRVLMQSKASTVLLTLNA